MKAFPDYKWLRWTLIEASNITRQQTWTPPKVMDILNMVFDSKRRLVQNGEQLLDILIESLSRLDEKLQGETPSVNFLWDEWDGRVKPKDENSFSDFIKLHLVDDLRQKGVIVNREVEIRSRVGSSGSSGERTDIHVDAIIEGQPYDTLTVIIEVKGCWHTDIKDAMKTQLVDRYLRDNPTQYGLFLIGWFNCSQWDSGDNRQCNAPKKSIEEARQQYSDQAMCLSQNGVHVKAFVMNTALR